MHCPKAFEENRTDVLLALIQQHPLATIISHSQQGLEVNVMPVLVKQDGEKIVLRGHLAKNNAQLQALAHSETVLWVFQGPNAYVSPAWYPSKQLHGKVVPTWNYMLVEAQGQVKVFTDEDELLCLVTDMTNEHEQQRASPWQVSDAPAQYVQSQLRGIVGIEMEVSQLRGKFKLSQNRSDEDQYGVRSGIASEQAEHAILPYLPQQQTQ